MKFQESELNIEVIDDTALINTSLIAKGRQLNKNQHCHQETKIINGKKKAQRNHRIEYYWIKKKKKIVAHAYSREEMLALSCQDMEYQLNKWTAVYRGLAASVAEEYDGLVASDAVRNNFYYDRRPLLEKPPHNFGIISNFLQFSFLHSK
ncbi:hypothetical protein C2S51_013531 [Perilla frutescens var. frutescens]|nr:hypothetical protein C2S51_013531 [Perilla frutescens var. frutescens]